ncbi:MAG: hypothetical protein R6V51_04510 [Dehalococcoidia bacterium]
MSRNLSRNRSAGIGERAGFIGYPGLQVSSAVLSGRIRAMVVVVENDTAVVLVVAFALSLAPAWIILDRDWAGRYPPELTEDE